MKTPRTQIDRIGTTDKAMKTIHFYLLVFLLSSTESKDPCDDDGHSRIIREGERYVHFKVTDPKDVKHDSRLKESWYNVGTDRMPETPPVSVLSCGTKYPIWLDGEHPTTFDIVNRSACVKNFDSNCSRAIEIRIKRCPRDIFLYYLVPTDDINEGYCFGTGKEGPAPTYQPPKPTLRYELHEYYTDNLPRSRVRFRCDFLESQTETLWYRVTWLKINQQRYKTPYSKSHKDESMFLTEDLFVENGFSMGENISCFVRAFTVQQGQPGKDSPMSDAMFVGIQVLTPSLSFTIPGNSSRMIRLKLSVPFGCEAFNTCSIWLTAYTPKQHNGVNHDCPGVALDTKTYCGVEIYSEDLGSEIYVPITVADKSEYRKAEESYSVYLQTDDSDSLNMWRKYRLPPITVNITISLDELAHQGKKCYAVPDPHLKTFDGRKFDNHQEGVFIMYRHTKNDAEVQIQHTPCNTKRYKHIKCPCGVAVRIGRDRYVITVCDKEKIDIGYKECADKVIVVERKGSKHYVIRLPYGTSVEVNINSNLQYMSVYISPSIHDDKGASLGLCGRLNDDDCHDDFHYRDKTLTPETDACGKTLYHRQQPIEFINAWKVTSKTENLFDDGFIHNAGHDWVHKICSCEYNTCQDEFCNDSPSGHVPCEPNSIATCTRGPKVNAHSCGNPNRYRRSLLNKPTVPDIKAPRKDFLFRKIRSETMNWTEEMAQTFCENTFATSAVFSLCENVPNANPSDSVETCVMDIMMTGSTDWTSLAIEGMRVSCLSELERNLTLRESTNGKPSLAELIEEKACPNNCSDMGVCNDGKCKCSEGYGAPDCSLDMSIGPTISGLLDNGLCDEQRLKCDNAYVFGHVFADEQNLTCKLDEFTISIDGTRTHVATHYLLGELETMIEVVCPLHKKRQTRSAVTSTGSTEFVFGYQISVSNDGNHFQTGHDLFVYNSECQTATNISGEIHFTLKKYSLNKNIGITKDVPMTNSTDPDDRAPNGYCYIDNECIKDGQRLGNCSICDSGVYPTSWATDISIKGCETLASEEIVDEKSTRYLWIIGVVAGVITGAVVAIIVILKIKGKRAKRIGDSIVFTQPPLEKRN